MFARSFNRFRFSVLLSGFSILISLTSAFAQSGTPTPTPVQYPPMPDSRLTGYTPYAAPNSVGKDDFIIKRVGTSPLYYVRNNDSAPNSEIFLNSATNRFGTLRESSSFVGSSTSSRQVLAYAGNQIGFDQGTYFSATVYPNAGMTAPYSSLATVNIFIIPNDGAENAGPTCPPCDGTPAKPGQEVGGPVNVTTGNMWLQQTDYSLPGVGESINLSRTYNSIIQTNGMFGKGWASPYDESLIAYGDHMVRINMPDGRAIYLGRPDVNSVYYMSPQGFSGYVVKNPDGSYLLNFKDGSSHLFSPTGKLIWQKDLQGNQTTLGY